MYGICHVRPVKMWQIPLNFRQIQATQAGSKKPRNLVVTGLLFGANYRTRTYDLLITNQLLYQLS